jgi:hypothetical protein
MVAPSGFDSVGSERLRALLSTGFGTGTGEEEEPPPVVAVLERWCGCSCSCSGSRSSCREGGGKPSKRLSAMLFLSLSPSLYMNYCAQQIDQLRTRKGNEMSFIFGSVSVE